MSFEISALPETLKGSQDLILISLNGDHTYYFVPLCHANSVDILVEQVKFLASGREDVDVRMLGKPFNYNFHCDCADL